MFLKRHSRTKAGKSHIYYSGCASMRGHRDRVVQRQIFPLGELNPTQLEAWQHSIDVLHDDGQRRQLRLFTDREPSAPNDPDTKAVLGFGQGNTLARRQLNLLRMNLNGSRIVRHRWD